MLNVAPTSVSELVEDEVGATKNPDYKWVLTQNSKFRN